MEDSIGKPEACEKLADSTIWFNSWDKGMTYFIVNLWIDGDNVIVESNVNSTTPSYKKITGDRATTLKSIVEKYKIKT
ncbi:MAG: hypothetical protein ACRC2K_05370 [Clostridium sp.]